MKTQASERSSAVPLQDIMKQLYDAAGGNPGRGGHHPLTRPIPINLKLSQRAPGIQDSINRACRKQFVRGIKPLRRLLRNQGAINDSVIEAVSQLFAQTQEMIEEMSELQRRIYDLELQIKELRTNAADPGATLKPE